MLFVLRPLFHGTTVIGDYNWRAKKMETGCQSPTEMARFLPTEARR
jgi:hypothetical protein